MRIGEDITADQIKTMREESGEGLVVCKKILEKQHALQEVDLDPGIASQPALQAVLRWLVEKA